MEESTLTKTGTFTRRELFKFLRIGRTKGYQLLKRSDFPLAVDLSGDGGTSQIWIVAEVVAWLNKQPRRKLGAEPPPLATGRRRYRDGKEILVSPKHRGSQA